MTPGPNLSRYERPLAERRLLGGALRDGWESVDRLPPVQFLVRRLCRERPYVGVVAVPVEGPRKPLAWCGIMEMSLAETRVSDVTRGTTTASSRHRLAGGEGGAQGARTGVRDPDLHLHRECQ